MRRAIKDARIAIENDDEDKREVVEAAIARVYRTKSKKVIKPNKASRTVARLMRALGSETAAAAE